MHDGLVMFCNADVGASRLPAGCPPHRQQMNNLMQRTLCSPPRPASSPAHNPSDRLPGSKQAKGSMCTLLL
jgi:hypothetical protein